MNEIRAVIFDVGGVLHESNTAVGDDMQQELGFTPDQINEIWQNQIPRLGTGQLDEVDFWKELSAKYGIRKVEPSEKLLSRAFARELKQNTQVMNIVTQLGQAGMKLAILSDTNAMHAEVLEATGSYAPFEYRFLSHETGIHKPDPRIFQKALHEMKVEADEAIFIDDRAENAEAAERLGIHGIVFENTEQFVHNLKLLLPNIEIELPVTSN